MKNMQGTVWETTAVLTTVLLLFISSYSLLLNLGSSTDVWRATHTVLALWARSGVSREHLAWRAGNAEGVCGGAEELCVLAPGTGLILLPQSQELLRHCDSGRQENCIS